MALKAHSTDPRQVVGDTQRAEEDLPAAEVRVVTGSARCLREPLFDREGVGGHLFGGCLTSGMGGVIWCVGVWVVGGASCAVQVIARILEYTR